MPPMTPGPVFVVGGSFGDYDRWCRRCGLREPWARYLTDPTVLLGLSNVLIIVVDGGWDRIRKDSRLQAAVNGLQTKGEGRVETSATEPPARAA